MYHIEQYNTIKDLESNTDFKLETFKEIFKDDILSKILDTETLTNLLYSILDKIEKLDNTKLSEEIPKLFKSYKDVLRDYGMDTGNDLTDFGWNLLR